MEITRSSVDTVKGPDDYMLDPEEDGLGCESNE